MDHPVIIMVAARADNGVIGVDGDLPWRIPADLRHFKQITKGRPMIMGRKTFDSLPGLLEGRRHIVLTRNADWEEEGAEVANSVDEALKLANGPHVCVIGGAEIYRLFLPHADRIELTEVKANPAGDTVLEPFDMSVWRELMRVANPAENGQPAFDFVTLVRKEG
ncbi:FolA Dihydrofolate reductase [Sphingomonadaceae bacterium]